MPKKGNVTRLEDPENEQAKTLMPFFTVSISFKIQNYLTDENTVCNKSQRIVFPTDSATTMISRVCSEAFGSEKTFVMTFMIKDFESHTPTNSSPNEYIRGQGVSAT